MTNNSQALVKSLLLSAPKGKRLDLAIASLLYVVRRQFVEVVLGSQRQISTIYCFFEAQRDDPILFSSADPLACPPRQAGKPVPDPVPPYASVSRYSWEVQNFARRVTITSCQAELIVVVSSGMRTWEERAPIMPHMERERAICRMVALATLRVYAPDIIPLLEAVQQEEQWEEVPAESAVIKHIQEIVLAPTLLPIGLLDDRRCQYQQYDIRKGIWSFCKQEWDGDENACYPAQCAACGGYYCELHLSDVSYLFDTAKEERCVYGTMKQNGIVCRVCALFPEESVRRLRATRLALNGEE